MKKYFITKYKNAKKKVIFFDRDGVLNKSIVKNFKPYAPTSLKNFKIYKNLDKHINLLIKKKYILYVVTNQTEFNKDSKVLAKMHKILLKKFQIKKIFCYYKNDNLKKKKPKTFLVKSLFRNDKIDKKRSFMIGDRWRDISFAKNLNIKSIFIQRNYNERLVDKPDFICYSTNQAIRKILSYEKKN